MAANPIDDFEHRVKNSPYIKHLKKVAWHKQLGKAKMSYEDKKFYEQNRRVYKSMQDRQMREADRQIKEAIEKRIEQLKAKKARMSKEDWEKDYEKELLRNAKRKIKEDEDKELEETESI